MSGFMSGQFKGLTPANQPTCVALANLLGVALAAGVSVFVLRV